MRDQVRIVLVDFQDFVGKCSGRGQSIGTLLVVFWRG